MFVFLFLCANGVYGQVKPNGEWMDQKFSMFIHFGLYSELGGAWDGKNVESGYSEQIQSHGGIFSDWYASVARDFNPVKWDAREVVSLAKAAGMKSVVFTSKHHDGFCMYHSKYTDFNVADATPFGRDVMKELSEACREQGVRFGVYFSLIDWHFPEAYPISSHNADPVTREHHVYNLKQVEEIMTNYGGISEIWFDMGSLTPQQSNELYELVNRLQPGCMVSGRLGNDRGDFSVMADNEYPDYKIGVPWQTAASFFHETWGYRSWQKRGAAEDKLREKILSLIKVVSRGGNYLLNIGPRGDGSVVEFEEEVLRGMGKWLERYGEGVYGAEANPFDHAFAWGDVTMKGNSLYLFVADRGAAGGVIRLEGVEGVVEGAAFVGGGSVEVKKVKGGIEVVLPERVSDVPVEVVRVDFKEGVGVVPVHYVSGGELSASNAVSLYAYSSMDYYTGFKSIIAYTWNFRSGKSSVAPVVYYTENERDKKVSLSVDGETRAFVLKDGAAEKLPVKEGSVQWGRVYMKPARGVFGRESEDKSGVDLFAVEGSWRELPDFKLGERMSVPALERQSFWLLQEVVSDRAQDVLVEVGSGNGVQVVLNGDYLTMHTSPRGTLYNKEVVLLPLRKGKNQLLLKLYNRFEKELCFSIGPDAEQVVYRLVLKPFPLRKGGRHDCSVGLAEPLTENSAMRLNNIRIELND